MALSYSGLVNYGKVTLPSVDEWSTNMNIVRDPPRSITTRKIEKVGDTSRIIATLAESDDRFCENISYYAKGVNPMVAVSYGEGGRGALASSGEGGSSTTTGEAFMPYRVVRDGVFRPPVWRQEDLMPLSRLPRNRFACDARVEKKGFAKFGACDCDLPTREIRDLLAMRCEARKTVAGEPDVCEPSNVEIMLRDPLAPGTMTTNASVSCDPGYRAPDNVDIMVRDSLRSLPGTMMTTNASRVGYEDARRVYDYEPKINLRTLRPTTDRKTNACGIASTSVAEMVPTDLRLALNRPVSIGVTNLCGPVFAQQPLSAFVSLPQKPARGSFDCRPSVPTVTTTGGNARLVGTVRRVDAVA